MRCEVNIDHKSVYYDNCTRNAKFKLVWKNSSGIFTKQCCTQHAKIYVEFFNNSKFDELISKEEINQLNKT